MAKACRGLRSSSAAVRRIFFFAADSGSGETNAKGLIVPQFGDEAAAQLFLRKY